MGLPGSTLMGNSKKHFFLESPTGFLFNAKNKSQIGRKSQKILKIDIFAKNTCHSCYDSEILKMPFYDSLSNGYLYMIF